MPVHPNDHLISRASGAQQRALLDFAVSQSLVIFYIADIAGERPVRFISSNVEAITGHKPASFLRDARYGHRHIHPDDLPGYKRGIDVLQERGAYAHEYRFRKSDGEYRWFRDELRLADNEEFVGCMIDISQRVAAEQESRRLARLLRDAVETMPNGFGIYDAEEKLTLCNSAFTSLFGETPDALAGSSATDNTRSVLRQLKRFEGERVSNPEALLSRALVRAREAEREPIEIQLESGRWLQITSHSLGNGGRVDIGTDITHLKHAEALLRDSEGRIRSIMEACPAPIRMWNPETGQVIYDSPAYRTLLGRDAADPTLKDRPSLYADLADRERYLALLGQAGAVDNMEMKLQRADGSNFWAAVSARLIQYRGENAIVSVIQDLTDQRQREEELRRARETLEDAIESLSEGLALYDADDRLVLCNSQYKSFHRDSEDLLIPGATWSDVTRKRAERGLFPRAIERIDEWLEEERAQRGIANNEEFPFAGDRWFEYSHRPTRQGGVVSTWRDVTRRKQREDELKHARETLEDAIGSLTEGFALFDANNGLVMCNDRFREFNEASADALVPGIDWLEFNRVGAERGQYPDAVGRIDEWLKEVASERGAATNEEFRQSDGRWFEYSHRETRQKGLVVTRRDITERKAMEQALRESEGIVRQVLEACPVVLTMNRVDDGVIIYESPAAQALLRHKEPQEGKSVISRWVNPDERQSYLGRLRRDGAVDGLEVHFRKADGEEFWCTLSSRLIDYRGEEVIVSNLFDLTDRRAAEAELARQREILHQSEKLSALGELLAGVSHELNNPLSVLVGQALMLKEDAPDDKVAARAEKIGIAADRCAQIVKSFLAMARQDPTEMEAIDLTAVVESALDVTAYSLRTSGIEVSLRMAKALPPVMADAGQMRQVFTNLIINAKDALQDVEGARRLRITSSYRKQSDQVVLKVKDNGPGISAEIRTRIFEPLYTTKETGTGTGIGLAMCHRIIEAHGGSILVERSPGEGAIFAIRLPRAKKARVPTAAKRRVVGKTTKCRVLVVDDEFDVGQIISDVLEHDGHSVDIAASGDLALQKIKRRHYDVVLSDIRMPGMDGPGFYRALSDMKPEQIAGLAFITGDTLSPQVKEFLDASERPYLEKPLAPRDIRELVDLLMRRKAN